MPENSLWSEGDWNGDYDFTTNDLVAAFQHGGYEKPTRAAQNVPEPTGLLASLMILVMVVRFRFTS